MTARIERVTTDVLDVAFERSGVLSGCPVVLLHGFPYDPRSFDQVAHDLAEAGADVIVPYLRGYGPTRFLSASTMRSGQQGALASDLHSLIIALGLKRPIVSGFDWGGRAACVAAMRWPGDVGGLVTISGYNVHDVHAMATVPAEPASEAKDWYQWYFQNERGRAGLERYRRELARQLWQEWSPQWNFDDSTFAATAASFDNPDFVEVVIHSYRVRYGLVAGDPAYDALEAFIAPQPQIPVPTIVIDPTEDPLTPPLSRVQHESHFAQLVDYQRTAVGHNTPREDPEAVTNAILALRRLRDDQGSATRVP
ncbi:pimeloyl-ACP methyl ester carboxylesterase [Salinibacterium sp. CAN_S4]|uniref:alpha/beta fold hydrolase n=1 Tax=Salinibacterium sp. CAN_S4 TaxID=2787727 RepID=UPI0018F00316